MLGEFGGPLPEEMGIKNEKADKQEIDKLVNHIRAKLEAGVLDPEKVKNLLIPDVNPVEKEIEGSVFGYNKTVELGSEIISLKGKEQSLYKGMTVELIGDSKGYVPSGHKSGERVIIIGFSDPEKGDTIVQVSGEDKTGYVKPSNIKPVEGQSPEEMGIKKEINKTEQEEKHQAVNLFDIYRHADDAARYRKNLEDIKHVAKGLATDLYGFGATNLPRESNLGQAYIDADRVSKEYTDFDQAKSAMNRIANLIHESDEFPEEAESWKQEKS